MQNFDAEEIMTYAILPHRLKGYYFAKIGTIYNLIIEIFRSEIQCVKKSQMLSLNYGVKLIIFLKIIITYNKYVSVCVRVDYQTKRSTASKFDTEMLEWGFEKSSNRFFQKSIYIFEIIF